MHRLVSKLGTPESHGYMTRVAGHIFKNEHMPEHSESYLYQTVMAVKPTYFHPFCIFGLGSNNYLTRKGSWVGNFWDGKPGKP